jgi:hypothetical protein
LLLPCLNHLVLHDLITLPHLPVILLLYLLIGYLALILLLQQPRLGAAACFCSLSGPHHPCHFTLHSTWLLIAL